MKLNVRKNPMLKTLIVHETEKTEVYEIRAKFDVKDNK